MDRAELRLLKAEEADILLIGNSSSIQERGLIKRRLRSIIEYKDTTFSQRGCVHG